MNYRLHSHLFDINSMLIIMILIFLIFTSQSVEQVLSVHIPNSMQQLNTIILSLLDVIQMEAKMYGAYYDAIDTNTQAFIG